MKIDSTLFDAYLKCPTKCWLQAAAEPSDSGTYAEWVKAQNDCYRVSAIRRLVSEFTNGEIVHLPDTKYLKTAKWRLALDLAVRAPMDCCILESEVNALECLPAEGRDAHAQFVPIRFAFANKLCSTTS